MRKIIADNGFALRKTLMGEIIKGYYPSPLNMEEMSIADLMSKIPDEDLLFVSSIKDRIYMPAEFFQKWVRPTIRVQKALKQSQDQELPGGMEAAMLASIFDQSIMDFTKPNNGNLADNRALRAMVWHTQDDNDHLKDAIESVDDLRTLLCSCEMYNNQPLHDLWCEALESGYFRGAPHKEPQSIDNTISIAMETHFPHLLFVSHLRI